MERGVSGYTVRLTVTDNETQEVLLDREIPGMRSVTMLGLEPLALFLLYKAWSEENAS